jgi:hypothetical protein
VAQTLAQEGYKVLYVTDIFPGVSLGEPDGNRDIYRYAFWDAYYKGLLPKDAARDERLKQSANQTSALRQQMQVDSLVYANDLWNSIGYTHLFTVWNFMIAAAAPNTPFHLPRRLSTDAEATYIPEPIATRYQRWNTEHEIKGIQSLCTRNFVPVPNQTQFAKNQQAWQIVAEDFRTALPEEFRRKTLMVVTSRSPYYLDKLPPQDRQCWQQGVDSTIELAKSFNFNVIAAGQNFTASDYNDSLHLVESGGDKLAELVTPEIKKLAQKNRYLP